MNNTETSNYRKYTSDNPIQRYLIGNFRNKLFLNVQDLDVTSILDAGCGEGFILSELKRTGIGNYLEGIDFSNDALSLGRELFPFLELKQGDIYSLPYEDNAFDLVICTEVLEHLETPEKALDEIVRVSKKYCLFSVPHEPYFRIANFVRGKNLSRWGNDIDHVQHWSCSGFEKFLRRKIQVISVMSPFPWTMVLGKKN